MSDDHSHSPEEEIKKFWAVFWALVVGTVITVLMAYVDLKSAFLTLAVGLAIATVKASLVAGFFMHLLAEKKLIYWVMAFTFFFFVAMVGLIVWGFYDYPQIESANVS